MDKAEHYFLENERDIEARETRAELLLFLLCVTGAGVMITLALLSLVL